MLLAERRRSSTCPCGRMSAEVATSSSRRSTNSSCSRLSDPMDDSLDINEDDVEYCDICKLLAPQVAARNQLMSALRNFMKDDGKEFTSLPSSNRRILGTLPNISPVKLQNSNQVLTLKSPQLSPIKKKRTNIPQTNDENSIPQDQAEIDLQKSSMNFDQPIEVITTHPQLDVQQNETLSNESQPAEIVSTAPLKEDEPNSTSIPNTDDIIQRETSISNDTLELSIEESDNNRGGFYDILENGILHGRIQIQVSGRKVTSTHVEYFLRVQVCVLSPIQLTSLYRF